MIGDAEDREPGDGFERCAHCGSRLPTGEWCPVVTITDEDGTRQVLSFCDDACRTAWAGDEGATPGE